MNKFIALLLLAASVSADAAESVIPVMVFDGRAVHNVIPQTQPEAVQQPQPDQQDDVVKLVDTRLMQILDVLNQSVQAGSCWMDGKAWSQGAVTQNDGHQVTCGKDADNWPKWQRVK